MIEKVTFVNTYRNTPQFLQEDATVIGNGGTQFRQKVKNRQAFIASREQLQPVHISPMQAGACASE